jgi:hypothetical protein
MPGGGDKDRSGILRRRYSGEPGPALAGIALIDKRLETGVNVYLEGFTEYTFQLCLNKIY